MGATWSDSERRGLLVFLEQEDSKKRLSPRSEDAETETHFCRVPWSLAFFRANSRSARCLQAAAVGDTQARCTVDLPTEGVFTPSCATST